jgi:hypothetical protein
MPGVIVDGMDARCLRGCGRVHCTRSPRRGAELARVQDLPVL